MATPSKRTIVQHSGVTTGHEEFDRGLETREVATAREQRAVAKAGGLLFDDYAQAEAYAEKEMYPPGSGLLPRAAGSFADLRIDGLKVYLPPVHEHTFEVTVTGCDWETAEDWMRAHVDELPPPTGASVEWGWKA